MIFFSVLLLLALPLYFGGLAIASTMRGGEGSGSGLSRSFALILTTALWTVLTALTVTAYLRDGMSNASAIAALVLVPFSAAVAISAINRTREGFGVTCPVVLCSAVPVLIATFASWAMFDTLHDAVAEWLMGGVVWSGVAAISIGSVLKRKVDLHTAKAESVADASDASEISTESRTDVAEQNNRAAFLALGPHVSLQKWLPFITPHNKMRGEALVAIRESPRRQADAEFLLKSGSLTLWRDVPELELKLTPTLAELGRKFIRDRARDIGPLHPNEAPNFEYVASRIEPYLAAIAWLVDQHCDCRAEVLSLISAIKLYPESEKRNAFLARLSSFRPPAVIVSRPPFPAAGSTRLESRS